MRACVRRCAHIYVRHIDRNLLIKRVASILERVTLTSCIEFPLHFSQTPARFFVATTRKTYPWHSLCAADFYDVYMRAKPINSHCAELATCGWVLHKCNMRTIIHCDGVFQAKTRGTELHAKADAHLHEKI